MTVVAWPTQEVWREARLNREYSRKENPIPIERVSTPEERKAWIAHLEDEKVDDKNRFFLGEYNRLIEHLKGTIGIDGFEAGPGGFEIRKEISDRLTQAHEEAADAFMKDPARLLPVDEDAWQDELRRRADFEYWVETGEAIKTTKYPEYVSAYGTLGAMYDARTGDSEAVSKDLETFKDKVSWEMNSILIDVPLSTFDGDNEKRLSEAFESIKRKYAAEFAVDDYLAKRGSIVTETIPEHRYSYIEPIEF
jgi:hypothetical protein